MTIGCASPGCDHRFAERDFQASRSGLVLFARCPSCSRSTPYTRDDLEAHARRTDPDTSHAAAAGVDVRKARDIVLAVMREHGPMTDERLVILTHGKMSGSGARTRRSELTRAGLVQDTGDRRQMASGNMAKVWEAVP